jgi:hypothetical protein
MSWHRLTQSDTSVNSPLSLKWVISAPVGGSFCMSRILFIFQDLFTSLTGTGISCYYLVLEK